MGRPLSPYKVISEERIFYLHHLVICVYNNKNEWLNMLITVYSYFKSDLD